MSDSVGDGGDGDGGDSGDGGDNHFKALSPGCAGTWGPSVVVCGGEDEDRVGEFVREACVSV